jgi:hypothetical protein
VRWARASCSPATRSGASFTQQISLALMTHFGAIRASRSPRRAAARNAACALAGAALPQHALRPRSFCAGFTAGSRRFTPMVLRRNLRRNRDRFTSASRLFSHRFMPIVSRRIAVVLRRGGFAPAEGCEVRAHRCRAPTRASESGVNQV